MSRPLSILWFRRDLRFSDHPALAKAASRGPVLALFVIDPVLMDRAGPPRRAFLIRTLVDLDRQLRGPGRESRGAPRTPRRCRARGRVTSRSNRSACQCRLCTLRSRT